LKVGEEGRSSKWEVEVEATNTTPDEGVLEREMEQKNSRYEGLSTRTMSLKRGVV